jgi:hypothetical protein
MIERRLYYSTFTLERDSLPTMHMLLEQVVTCQMADNTLADDLVEGQWFEDTVSARWQKLQSKLLS